ncbi:uncharacterized protein LOC109861093 isoform X2 [Pseudomyrmex gracilis]|uniref:uncharacterized protein LOC109861093 isoform X2 n=1 Tax=Pseudomyrmex gracilis TaxID=219809 RepID=UPI0009958B81|nr:uncharacterized protein LOC109861093 isoform X2 [Pseudomyrmex gracilis]
MSETSLGFKRLTRITWSEYFMGIAFLSAKRCEDQDMNGACIVNNDNIIVGIGYNTLPEGCENMKSKKGIACHAEVNAIKNTDLRNVKGCTMYVTSFPCNNCANVIIQSGIKKIIYLDDNSGHKAIAAKHMFESTGVTYVPYNTNCYKKPIDHTKKKQINSEEYFMGIAYLSSRRSKEAMFDIGACIVNKDGVVVGTGYNGMPRGMDEIPKLKTGQSSQCTSKLSGFFKVCHAVINAVLNRNTNNIKDSTLYVTTYPCIECAKIILQFGITRLVHMPIKQNIDTQVAKELLETAAISIRKYNLSKEMEIYEEASQTSETTKDIATATNQASTANNQVVKIEHLMMNQAMREQLMKMIQSQGVITESNM